ncbi:MAG: sugar ABC transporter ATP-binding protein [Gemmatimonadales bacterium]
MPAAVRFLGVTKRFPGVVALRGVSFDVAKGTCHAVCGENGAGKSTLGKLLSGIDRPDEGTIEIDGRPVRFLSPAEALAAGVAMVHQELASCSNLSVAENLCLGKLPSRWKFVNRPAMHARAAELLADIGAEIDTSRAMSALNVAEQQLVQIASAVGSGARVIVFDEPTSSLSEREAVRLYDLVGRLTAGGATLLYVSHRMPEIFRLCGQITVLRDGEHVATRAAGETSERELVQLMIGRHLEQRTPVHLAATPGSATLDVRDLGSRGKFEQVSFSLRAGEVLGLAGLVGAGRSEIAKALFGLDPNVTGSVAVHGAPTRIRSARDAMRLGIGLVPEDRKVEGLVLSMGSLSNVTLPLLDQLSRATWIRRRDEQALGRKYFERLRVKVAGNDAPASGLSGGNQQKLVLARWLAAGSRILILDEPTRGVDVGAKAELHEWIAQLAADGHAILLISSELPELLYLSSRVMVLRHGRVVGEVARGEATEERVLGLMAGVSSFTPLFQAKSSTARA